MSTSRSGLRQPRGVIAPGPRPASPAGAVVILLGGVLLAGAGLSRLPGELDQQLRLAPLTRSGGWQRAFVEEGAPAPAARAEEAARRSGHPAALAAAAEVLAGLSAVSGDAEQAAGLRRRALELSRAALARSPGLAQAHLMAGAALAGMEADPGQADWHLSRAAALDPNRASLRRSLGLMEVERGRPRAGAVHLAVALTAVPQRATEVYQALEVLGASLSPEEVTPPLPVAQVALGGWLEARGDLPGARRAFERALTLADTTPPAGGEQAAWAYAQLAGLLLRHGLLDDAEALAAGRLAAGRFDTPEQEALLAHHRGAALVQSGRLDEGMGWLRRAWELDRRPVHGDALARALARQGRHAEAAAVWEEALGPDGGGNAGLEAAMRLGRAASLAATGDRPRALREVGRVLMADPLNQGARALAAELAYE